MIIQVQGDNNIFRCKFNFIMSEHATKGLSLENPYFFKNIYYDSIIFQYALQQIQVYN